MPMLEQTALVVEENEGLICVETQPVSSCSHCSNNGCSSSVLADLLKPKANRFYLENSLGAKPGQQVIIGIPEDRLLSASIKAYLVPLLLMLLVTAFLSLSGASETMQALLAMAGLGVGFAWISWQTSSKATWRKFNPRVIRFAASGPVQFEIQNLLRSKK